MAAPAAADRISLSSGIEIKGEIITSDTERVFIRTEGGELGVLRRQIASIEIQTRHITAVHSGLLDILGRRAIPGLEQWAQAAQSGDVAALAELDPMLIERDRDLRVALGSLSERDRPAAIPPLASLAANDGLSLRARYACLQSLLALDADDAVEPILAGPFGEQLARDPEGRAFLIGYWREVVRRKLALRQHSDALRAVEQLHQLDPGAGDSQKALWVLSRIGEARDRGDILEAIRLAAVELGPLMPEVAQNRVELLLAELPDWVTAPDASPQRFDAARELLESTLRPNPYLALEADRAMEEVYLARGALLIGEGHTSEALTFLTESGLRGSRSSIDNLAIRAEFLYRQNQLDPANPLELYRLGEWALEKKRYDWAFELFKQAAEFPMTAELAGMQLRILKESIQSKALEDSIALYRAGRYFDALESLTPILQGDIDTTASPYLPEARNMADLIRRDLDNQSRKRPYQAEVLFQQAERAFFVRDYQSAIRDLAEVLRSYSDTPAAGRADQLLSRLLRDIRIEQIEGRRLPIPEIPAELRERASIQDTSRLDNEIRSLLDAMQPAQSPASENQRSSKPQSN